MFTLSDASKHYISDTLDRRLSSGEKVSSMITNLLPLKVTDPETYHKMTHAIQKREKDSSLEEPLYLSIDEQQFYTLHHMIRQVEKLVSGAGIDDSRTLETAQRIERPIRTLLRMMHEDSARLHNQVKYVSEAGAQNIAHKVHIFNKKFNPSERETETEMHEQKYIQAVILNECVDRLEACRSMVNLFQHLQSELRSHARAQPLIQR